MDQVTSEKRLTITYTLCIVFGAVSSITTGIAWGHWKQTLDQCIGRNCSCILYGHHTPLKFLGGDMAPCIWVTFAPVLYVLFCIGMTCFHGYRVLFSSRSIRTRTLMSKNESGEVVQMRTVQVDDTDPLPRAFWIAGAIFTAFFTIYSLIHFAIFLDGFYTTCNQYRKTLEKRLGAHGTSIPVVHGRLSCQGIFDFMDYMEPDSGNGFRDGFINTGLDLIIGVVASFFSWLAFASALYLNIKNAKKRSE